MYPLFETIRYYNGILENIEFHQERVNNTLTHLKASTFINLYEHFNLYTNKPALDNKTYKCRIQYDLNGNIHIQFEQYAIRNISTFSIKDIEDNTYPYKYSERNWLTEIVSNSGTDEVILAQNGYIKDASYANLVFFNGTNWITPSIPLLMGTRRAALIKEGTIMEAPIQITDLDNFVEFKLINAMMLWEESPIFTIESIKHLS